MTKVKTGTGDWIVVCDGRKALILENAGDAKFPNLKMRETYDHDSKPTHALGTDQPGRSHQSVGHHRSAVTQTDWHDQAERSFLHMLAARLQEAVADRQTKALVMIAAPRALGMIRDEYSPALQRAITREIAKDAVKLPIHEIEGLVFGTAAH
jgi:protein required for attachment to host cells